MNQTPSDRTVDYQPPTADVTLTQAGGSEGSREAPAQFSPPGYELFDEIGRGGMGVVYKARHRSLNRLVALKVILGAGHAGSVQLSRFRAEATAAAQLQHPNIVQVYEIGEWRSSDHSPATPFMSLELVDGGGLDKFLDGVPQPPRLAAEVIRVLALAVQHAHEKGIVHRDLKPANILVVKKEFNSPDNSTIELTGKSDSKEIATSIIPKITDFGLAKQTSEVSHVTASGAILGTPSYMAPEQAAGKGHDAGPGVDIYALGAILYECLTGRPPFRAASVMDTVMQVLNDEPVPPSRLQPKLPLDLETICLKCLSKKSEQRYESAAALAEDLRRYLAGESILARPVTRLHKFWKWAKRYPAIASIVFILAVPLPLMLIVMVGLWIQARESRLEAEKDRTNAIAARDRADRDRELALGYLKSSMHSMDRVLDLVSDEHLGAIPDFKEPRKLIIDEAVSLYESLLRLDSSEPSVRIETAQIYNVVGRLHLMGSNVSEANKSYLAAIELLKPLVEEYPKETEYRHQLATSYYYLGHTRLINGKMEEGIALYHQADQMMQQILVESDDKPEYLDTAAEITRSIGFASSSRNLGKGRQYLEKALSYLEKSKKKGYNTEFHRCLTANIHGDYATITAGLNRLDEAREHIRLGEELLNPKVFPMPKSGRARIFYVNGNLALDNAKAQIAVVTQNLEEAEKLLFATAQKYELLVKGIPKSFPYRYQALSSYIALGSITTSQKKWDKLQFYNQRGLALVQELRRDFPSATWLDMQLTVMQVQLGFAYYYLNRQKELDDLIATIALPADLPDLHKYNLVCLNSLASERASPELKKKYLAKALELLPKITQYPITPKQLEEAKKDEDLKAIRGTQELESWFESSKKRLQKK